MKLWNAAVIALATYSRIPMPRAEWTEENRRYALCFFPLVGLACAAVLWLWSAFCARIGIGLMLYSAGCALLPLALTGGIHMDGLMDTADALAACQSPERRLEILKDSRAGAFAVMACAAYLLLSAALWAELGPDGIGLALPGFIASRALSALALTHFRIARPGGMLGSFAAAAGKRAVTFSCLAWLLLSAVLWGQAGGPGLAASAALVCAASLFIYRRRAYRDFGGVTGDLAGAYLQALELCLLLLAVLWRKGL